MMIKNIRKYVLPNVPYLFALWFCLKLGIFGVQLNADVAAVEPLRRQSRCTASEKRVDNNSVFGTARENTGFG